MEYRRVIMGKILTLGKNVLRVPRGSYRFLSVNSVSDNIVIYYEEGTEPIDYKDIHIEVVRTNHFVPTYEDTNVLGEYYGTIVSKDLHLGALHVYRTK